MLSLHVHLSSTRRIIDSRAMAFALSKKKDDFLVHGNNNNIMRIIIYTSTAGDINMLHLCTFKTNSKRFIDAQLNLVGKKKTPFFIRMIVSKAYHIFCAQV